MIGVKICQFKLRVLNLAGYLTHLLCRTSWLNRFYLPISHRRLSRICVSTQRYRMLADKIIAQTHLS
jgi:hypothetical protein